MNTRISRSSLVLAALCFAFFAVVGLGYSQNPPSATDCQAYDNQLSDLDAMLENCATFNDCGIVEIMRNNTACLSAECWDVVDGVCSAQ